MVVIQATLPDRLLVLDDRPLPPRARPRDEDTESDAAAHTKRPHETFLVVEVLRPTRTVALVWVSYDINLALARLEITLVLSQLWKNNGEDGVCVRVECSVVMGGDEKRYVNTQTQIHDVNELNEKLGVFMSL